MKVRSTSVRRLGGQFVLLMLSLATLTHLSGCGNVTAGIVSLSVDSQRRVVIAVAQCDQARSDYFVDQVSLREVPPNDYDVDVGAWTYWGRPPPMTTFVTNASPVRDGWRSDRSWNGSFVPSRTYMLVVFGRSSAAKNEVLFTTEQTRRLRMDRVAIGRRGEELRLVTWSQFTAEACN